VNAVKLFTWIQDADFYHDLHRKAVETLPKGKGRTWLDVGCGPGLVARLAAAHGYSATGIDTSPQMIHAARNIAKDEKSQANFRVGDIHSLPVKEADVVSAASLLVILENKRRGLTGLWKCVRPGGTLLIIEPTDKMTVENAEKVIERGLPGRRTKGLRMWATARQGKAVDPGIYNDLRANSFRFVALLHGLVGAWLIRKKR
jgi:ubiquinone/menaquinone biosynthesis C-methylase UbiE